MATGWRWFDLVYSKAYIYFMTQILVTVDEIRADNVQQWLTEQGIEFDVQVEELSDKLKKCWIPAWRNMS